MLYRFNLTGLLNNMRVKQTATLYAASFAGIPFAIVTSIVFTRFLGPQVYGDFSFLGSLFDFAIIIFPMGFFFAGNRALVLNHDIAKAREYFGATLVYLFLLFGVMALVLTLYALTDPNLAAKELNTFFLFLLPFSWIFLLEPYFATMLPADNRIKDLAATRFFPKLITFTAAIAIYYFGREFGGNRLAIIWIAHLASFLSVYAFVFVRIKISFANLWQRMQEIWKLHRSYGIHLYTGTLFSAGAIALTGVLISYFSDDNTGVGFFVLAIAIARPMALIPGAIAASWFKYFASEQRISRQLLLGTLLLTGLALIALMLLAGPFIRFFYSHHFLPVIPLVYIAACAMLCWGLGGFFSRFLEAHGHGKAVRNAHIIMGIALLAGNLLLIPPHGPTGALIAMTVAKTLYLAGMVWAYKKSGKRLVNQAV